MRFICADVSICFFRIPALSGALLVPLLYHPMRFIVYLASVTIWLHGCSPSDKSVSPTPFLNPPGGSGGPMPLNGSGRPAPQPTSPAAGGTPASPKQVVILRSIASDIAELTRQVAIMLGLTNEFPQAEIDWDSFVEYTATDGDFLSLIIQLAEQIRSKLMHHVSFNLGYPMYTAVAMASLSELAAADAHSEPDIAEVIHKFMPPAVEALIRAVMTQDPTEATSIDRLFESINRSLPPNRRDLLIGFYSTAALTLVVSPESRGLIDARVTELEKIMMSPTSAPGMSWYALKQLSDVADEDLLHHIHDRPLDRLARYQNMVHPFGPLEL